jgi:hypothetical protein
MPKQTRKLLAVAIVALIMAAFTMLSASLSAQSVPDSQPSGRPKGIPISFESEWISDSDVGLSTQTASFALPLLRGFGSPPPIVRIGYAYTDLSAPQSLDLPGNLHEYSTGLSWVRKFNERWTVWDAISCSLQMPMKMHFPARVSP